MNETLTLPDGRVLGYAEYGDPGGRPVFYFHGFPGSRIEARLFDRAAAQHNARIIAVDRPGMGLSAYMPQRRIVDWPRDITALAGHLGLDKFVVVGASGGGPYSAVCARALSERVTTAVLLAGVGPMQPPNAMKGMSAQNQMLFRVSRWAPPIADLFMVVLHRQSSNQKRLMRQIQQSSSAEDKRVLQEHPEIVDVLYESFVEAFRQGSRGAKRELYLYSRRWGFRLDAIEVPVFLWQGEKDANVPPSMGRYMAGVIPGCKATFLPGDGHMGTIFNHLDEIFRAALSS
jgi:pimeloyl-ACP methyl ester carboxylesterase